MADTIVFLQIEHRTIARLLDLIDAQRRRGEAGSALDLRTLALVFEYFREYPDSCHHPKEDEVFRRLQQRDPVAAAELGDLLGDHRALENLTVRVANQVVAAASNGGAATPALLEELRRFVAVYREHLQAEDDHFLPTVAEKLTREDWDLIDFSVFDRPDPLYDAEAESRFSALRRRIFDPGSDQRAKGVEAS